MFLLVLSSYAFAGGEYAVGDANAGIGASYGMGRLNTWSAGMNFNFEGAAGTVSSSNLPSSMFFHTRMDFDVLGIGSLDDSRVDLGMDIRINLHTGFQFFGVLPVNFAMKDARFGFYRDSFVTHGLYGVGVLLPKEYFGIQNENHAVNISLNLGSRVREDFGVSPAALQPELLWLAEDFSIRLGVLQTFGSTDSNEFSTTGVLAYNNLLLDGTQLGIQWRYARWTDIPTNLDSNQTEIMFFIGGNPDLGDTD